MKTEENPAHANWYAQDQQLLSFFFNSVTKEVLGQIATEASAASAWRAILGMFSSQPRARIMHLWSKLSGTCKGELTTCATYYAKMKGFIDEMTVTGKCRDHEEVITYILAGLDFEYNLLLRHSLSRLSLKRSMTYICSFLLQKHELNLRRSSSRSLPMPPFVAARVVTVPCIAAVMAVLWWSWRRTRQRQQSAVLGVWQNEPHGTTLLQALRCQLQRR
jgi:hypothetical protein